MRLNIAILFIIIIGLSVGGTSAWYSVQRSHGIGGINIGAWTAWPFAGGADADPYIVAKVARDGTIPLGATEGLAFEAQADSSGQRFTFDCNYILSGLTPPARLWTLTAYGLGGTQVTPGNFGKSAIFSGNLLRFADGSFRIGVSKFPVSGNWLSVSGDGNFQLVLRIYDTPATSTTGLVSRRMPSIIRGECVQ